MASVSRPKQAALCPPMLRLWGATSAWPAFVEGVGTTQDSREILQDLVLFERGRDNTIIRGRKVRKRQTIILNLGLLSKLEGISIPELWHQRLYPEGQISDAENPETERPQLHIKRLLGNAKTYEPSIPAGGGGEVVQKRPGFSLGTCFGESEFPAHLFSRLNFQ